MPSTFSPVFFSAVMLAALLLCASGAPVEDALADGADGDPSGDELVETEKSSELDFKKWKMVIQEIQRAKKAFEVEFQHIDDNQKYSDSNKPPSIPQQCNMTHFRKEACLQRLAQGLLVFSVFLKHAETEYPISMNFSEAQSNIGNLISLANTVKQKMKNSDQVTAPSSSQEQQLLQEVSSPDPFSRKMRALSILKCLSDFLVEGKRSICRMELKPRKNRTGTLFLSADTAC